MDLKLIAKDQTSLEVEIPGETETLLEPLRSALLRNPKVTVATYHADHPWFDSKRLFIRVTEGDPMDALHAAAASIRDDLNDAIEQLGALKEP
jgi:DNA-directed RNA polymerase subunit L